MRKSLFRWTVAMLTLSAAAVSGACSEQEYEDLTKPEKVTGNTQYAPYTIDWTEAADSCSTAFIERFYCSENRNGYEGVFSYREYNATGGANFNNYWQQAHAMAAMVEYYNRIKATDAEEKARIEGYFQNGTTSTVITTKEVNCVVPQALGIILPTIPVGLPSPCSKCTMRPASRPITMPPRKHGMNAYGRVLS